MKYNKLVRDNIISIMQNEGLNPQYHVLNNEEYISELNKKLVEETNEYLFDEKIEELADIIEVIYAILRTKHVNINKFNQKRNSKAKEKGKFTKKIFLESDE